MLMPYRGISNRTYIILATNEFRLKIVEMFTVHRCISNEHPSITLSDIPIIIIHTKLVWSVQCEFLKIAFVESRTCMKHLNTRGFPYSKAQYFNVISIVEIVSDYLKPIVK